jgi:hypothetical protein
MALSHQRGSTSHESITNEPNPQSPILNHENATNTARLAIPDKRTGHCLASFTETSGDSITVKK